MTLSFVVRASAGRPDLPPFARVTCSLRVLESAGPGSAIRGNTGPDIDQL